MNQARIFPDEWHRRFDTIHVYGRDIFLLLPNGGLPSWSLARLADERYPSEQLR